MTDPVRQRIGNRALNAVTDVLINRYPEVRRALPAERRVSIAAFVRSTPDADLLLIPRLGYESLARLRAEWPYDPPSVMRCPCCNQPMPPPETPLGE